MDRDTIRLIEAYFTDHDGDGDFARHERAAPYSVIAPRNACRHLLLTTKPGCVLATTSECEALDGFALIGGFGLPAGDDLGSLSAFGINVTDVSSVPLAQSEFQSLSVLRKILGDLRDTVGIECAEVLAGGDKIELEAVFAAKDPARNIFQLVGDLSDT